MTRKSFLAYLAVTPCESVVSEFAQAKELYFGGHFEKSFHSPVRRPARNGQAPEVRLRGSSGLAHWSKALVVE